MMLEVVKNVHFSTDSLSGNEIMTLRHITSFINFSLVINLHLNLDSFILFLLFILILSPKPMIIVAYSIGDLTAIVTHILTIVLGVL